MLIILLIIILLIIPIVIVFTTKHKDDKGKGDKGKDDKGKDDKGVIVKVPTDTYKFTMDNGLNLSYGEIMALGGDIYGTNKPISDAKTPEDAEKLFLEAFNTLNKSDGTENKWSSKFGKSIDEVPKILNQFDIEIEGIRNAISKNQKPSDFYANSGNSFDIVYNEDTGGGSKIIPDKVGGINLLNLLEKGRYMELAQLNWDHFVYGGCAWRAYSAGHSLAKKTAARATTNEELELAYKYNAFACHFLSDYFAAGHLRTPRKALHNGHTHPERMKFSDKILNTKWSVKLGDLMSKLMHDEDNTRGLWVKTNGWKNGVDSDESKIFKTFGDGHYANEENKESREQQRKVLQKSIMEVWKSYKNKKIWDGGNDVWNMLPNIDSVDKDSRNIPAMFKDENGLITKRTKGGKRTVVVVQTYAILEFKLSHDNVNALASQGENIFWNYVK